MTTKGRLTIQMYELATEVARARDNRNTEANRTKNYGYTGDSFAIHLPGALAEAFIAQTLQVPWSDTPFAERHDPDVGWVDVRSTSRQTGGLILHEDDPDGRPFVLVLVPSTDFGCTMTLAGWCYGLEGKQPRYWRADVPRPCFIVPQHDLHDASTLARTGGDAVR